MVGDWQLVCEECERCERERDGRRGGVVASGLSKYVVEKGRFTVSSERGLRSAEHLAKSRNRDIPSGASTARYGL